jgi:PAS domain S-box-containing protein
MPTTERVNILMVDDQPGKLISYQAILGDLGENLITATSAKEALDHLLRQDVAVILMDVSMPDLDGFELADMIRQHPRFQKTAIIFISAVHLTDLDRIKGYQRGAMDYISVPVVPELLKAKVSVFADLYRKTRELESLNIELEQRVLARTEQLRESEEQFRTLADSIPQLAWVADPDGSISWYNQRWYDYTGRSFDDVQGWGWRSVYHPDHIERVVATMQRAWDTGEPWEETSPLLGCDGSYRWFLTRAIPIRDSQGKLVRWFGTSTDISRQIDAEQQIRNLNSQLEQRIAELETIMQVLPVGVSVAHDPECRVITRNAALNYLLDLEPGENLSPNGSDGNPPYEVYRAGRRIAPNELPLQQAATAGKPVGIVEFEIRLKSGRVMQALASANPLFDDQGSIRGAVGALIDITERKQMEHILSERADLLELASEAIIVRDMNGIVQFWNAGAASMYGWTTEEAVGEKLHQLLQTRFPVPVREIEFTIAQGLRWEGNLTQVTRDGREIIVDCRKILQRDGRKGQAVLEICRDITSQLQAEEALRRSEKLAAMGKMAGIVAHEINNPLEAIINLFYLVQKHPSLDAVARSYADMAERELSRVAHITKQTLAFYRESAQAIPVSIPELLDDLLEFQSRQLEKSKIAVDRQFRSSRLVQGFPAELKQVFLNLVGNAIEAMPEGGRLRVRVCDSVGNDMRPGVRIFVSDTGSGIKQEDANRLFEPFFSTKSTKGTGLGLWISKGIIRKYEGTIRFRSASVAKGNVTCFSVFLPATALLVEAQLNAASVASLQADS